MQIAMNWVAVTAIADPATADSGGTIYNPATDITDQNRIVRVMGRGSQIVFQFRYDEGESDNGTSPVINVFGRGSSNDNWTKLRNKDESTNITLTKVYNTDATDAAYCYTEIDENEHVVDLLGNNEFIVGIQTAYIAGTSGATTNCRIQAKVI